MTIDRPAPEQTRPRRARVRRPVATDGNRRLRETTTLLRVRGYPQDLLADAESVFSELMVDAVTHGEPNATGEVEISWHAHDASISVIDVFGASAPT